MIETHQFQIPTGPKQPPSAARRVSLVPVPVKKEQTIVSTTLIQDNPWKERKRHFPPNVPISNPVCSLPLGVSGRRLAAVVVWGSHKQKVTSKG